jgi:hypothetical protein
MSGYMTMMADCFLCGKLFSSNPNKVPSVQNQPICESCMVRVQEARKAQGMKPFPVPPGAYEAEEV